MLESANPVGSPFNKYPKSNHFSPSPTAITLVQAKFISCLDYFNSLLTGFSTPSFPPTTLHTAVRVILLSHILSLWWSNPSRSFLPFFTLACEAFQNCPYLLLSSWHVASLMVLNTAGVFASGSLQLFLPAKNVLSPAIYLYGSLPHFLRALLKYGSQLDHGI